MNPAAQSYNSGANSSADACLRAAVRLWFVAAMIGQWTFLYYILEFYGRTTFSGNFEAWTKNTFLRKGYVAGDTTGNIAFAAHALLAGVIAFGGALQLVPQIRSRAISLHRWLGRVFFVTALGLSVSGLYVLWAHGEPPNFVHGFAISANAALIVAFSLLAWSSARKGDVSVHRRWALRAYLVANAQWFIRVGIIVWMVLTRKLLGVSWSFDTFFLVWDFGCYLIPLGVLELYLYTSSRAGAGGRLAMATGLAALTLAMSVGSVGFFFFTRPLLEAVK